MFLNLFLLYIFFRKVKMKKTRKATSIIEAMVTLLIITVWIVWVFTIYSNSRKLSDTTKYRIEAIEIAREGIEAMKNIRDTNYLALGSDTVNCWNTFNYNWTCVWDNTTTKDISSWSYIIYQDTISNRWLLSGATTWIYSDSAYRNNFIVKKDTNWFYTQSWWTVDLKPIFTREIQISYLSNDSNQPQMNVKSLVQWSDSSGTHKVDLDLSLYNQVK